MKIKPMLATTRDFAMVYWGIFSMLTDGFLIVMLLNGHIPTIPLIAAGILCPLVFCYFKFFTKSL